ncbi:MAG: dihydrofolate reductase, partial [Candidatus Azotimanducaceae bacterium]
MTVSLVAARTLNDVIGNGPNIPWRVKGEQKLFREITLGGILIMGRKTYESIGKPLPGRST